MLCFMAASLLSAAVAVLFSTFLSPLFATLASGLFIGIPALITLQFGGKWAYAFPCTRSSVPCSTRHSARRGISSGRY